MHTQSQKSKQAQAIYATKTVTRQEWLLVLLVAALLVLAGCDSSQPALENFAEANAADAAPAKPAIGPDAAADELAAGLVVQISPTRGHEVSGTVVLSEAPGAGLNMEIALSGLKPGKHGFHVHEKGDCSAADAMSAGGHYNPTNQSHGAPGEEERHAGDLGNLDADSMGNARASFSTSELSLSGPHGIRGRAFVVHSQADDLESQPSGDSGSRVACGVIGSMNG